MTQRHLKPALMAAAVSLAVGNAWANPTGPTVSRGAALLSNPNATTLQIVNTPGTIINWQGFSIAANELTRFVQENAASAVLNRVTGGSPSSILGQLRSNGRVFLVNPNGIVFGAGSVVDTAALIASTRDIGDTDFLAGNYLFSGAGSGTLSVQGGASITTASAGNGGTVWLFAKDVTIAQGASVTAPQGQVVLAAGAQVVVGNSSLGNMSFNVNTSGSDTIQSLGTIAASQGAVGLFADFINHAGSLTADQGKVAMNATRDLTIRDNSSVIAANGTLALRGGNKLEIERLASVWADGAQGSITLESNDLRIYPWPDTLHAIGGTVSYVLTDPGSLQIGASTQVDSFNIVSQSGVYLLGSGDVRATWGQITFEADPNGLASYTVMSGDFSPAGNSIGGGGALGTGAAGNFGPLAASAPANLGSRSGWINYLGGTGFWPTSDGGSIGSGAAPGTWVRLASDGTTMHTLTLPGVALNRLQSAIPMADGTVFALYYLNGSTFGRRYSAGGTVIGPDVQMNTSLLNSDFAGFGTKDGGAVVLSTVAAGGGASAVYTLNATQITKVPAPYLPANNIQGTAGAVTGGVTPGNPTATPVLSGSGSGATLDEVSGCNASVCSPEVVAARAQLDAERAAQNVSNASSMDHDASAEAVNRLFEAARRSRDAVAAGAIGVLMRDNGELRRLVQGSPFEQLTPQQRLDRIEQWLAQEAVHETLGETGGTNINEINEANAVSHMNSEQRTVWAEDIANSMRAGDDSPQPTDPAPQHEASEPQPGQSEEENRPAIADSLQRIDAPAGGLPGDPSDE